MVDDERFRKKAKIAKLDISHRSDMPFYASRETRVAYFIYETKIIDRRNFWIKLLNAPASWNPCNINIPGITP